MDIFTVVYTNSFDNFKRHWYKIGLIMYNCFLESVYHWLIGRKKELSDYVRPNWLTKNFSLVLSIITSLSCSLVVVNLWQMRYFIQSIKVDVEDYPSGIVWYIMYWMIVFLSRIGAGFNNVLCFLIKNIHHIKLSVI